MSQRSAYDRVKEAAWWVLVLSTLALIATAFAKEAKAQGPFVQGAKAPIFPPQIVPPSITPSSAFQTGGVSVAEPSLLSSNPVQMPAIISSPPPLTALDQLPGTGSKSPTGPILGRRPEDGPTTGTEGLALLARLRDRLDKLELPKPEVTISPTLPPETSQSLSQASTALTLLGWVGSGVLTIFGLGRLSPLAALVVRGLQSVIAARSQAKPPSPGLDALLLALSKSLVDKVEAGNSTPPPAS